MKKCKLLLFELCSLVACNSMAQIGYQVSLLNNATGEPRANESVNVIVRISDNDGGIICEQTKQETTNDFGVLSMTVGDSGTFQNADWSKLPFFIEASVDGRLIGKSQILSVPIAEYAKQTGVLTKEILCSRTWPHDDGYYLKFTEDAAYYRYPDTGSKYKFKYYIEGNFVILTEAKTMWDGGQNSIETGVYLWVPAASKLVGVHIVS